MSLELLHQGRNAPRSPQVKTLLKRTSKAALEAFANKAKQMHSATAEVLEEVSHKGGQFLRSHSEGALKTPKKAKDGFARSKSDSHLKEPEHDFWAECEANGRGDSATPSGSPRSPETPTAPKSRYSKESMKDVRKKLFTSELPLVEEAAEVAMATPKFSLPKVFTPKDAFPNPASSGIGGIFGHKLMNPEMYGGGGHVALMSTVATKGPFGLAGQKSYMSTLALQPEMMGGNVNPLASLVNGADRAAVQLAEDLSASLGGVVNKVLGDYAYHTTVTRLNVAFGFMKFQANVKKYFGDPINLQMLVQGVKYHGIDLAVNGAEQASFLLAKLVGLTGFTLSVVYAQGADPHLDAPLLNYTALEAALPIAAVSVAVATTGGPGGGLPKGYNVLADAASVAAGSDEEKDHGTASVYPSYTFLMMVMGPVDFVKSLLGFGDYAHHHDTHQDQAVHCLGEAPAEGAALPLQLCM